MKASKIVTGAIIGLDFKTVIVNNKAYVIHPPTIAKIAGSAYYLSDIEAGETLNDIIKALKDMNSASKALSWLIKGDESLAEELSHGTLDEVAEAIEIGLGMISAENFIKLSVLAKNVQMLTARPK